VKEFAGKKVLILIENLPVPFDRRMWQQALALKDKGADVTVICPKMKGYDKTYERLEGIDIYRHYIKEAGRKTEYLFEYITALFWETVLTLWVFFKKGIDVIHACNPPDLIFLVALPYKMIGKKFIFDHHDLCPELMEAKYGKKGFFYKLLRTAEKLTFMSADISMATNESYKKIAVERGGMKKENVFIVRSGPDIDRMKIVPPDESCKEGKEYLVGYVGVIGRQEGLRYLIDAIKYIECEKKREDIHFVCIGSGPDLENVKNYASEKDVDNFITFTGRVSDEDMMRILGSCDVCVNCDEYNQMNDKSTMNKIMEYMALKKPIVQFDLKEGRFSAGESSLYARPNDSKDMAEKIIKLVSDKDRREKMGQLGYERVKNKLSWDHEKPNLYSAYREVFGLMEGDD